MISKSHSLLKSDKACGKILKENADKNKGNHECQVCVVGWGEELQF